MSIAFDVVCCTDLAPEIGHRSLKLVVARDVEIDLVALADGLVGSSTLVVQYQFQPQGRSVVVATADGSVAMHSWPELGLVTVDLYGASALQASARYAI